MKCANATELYLAMWADLETGTERIASDGAQTSPTREAEPCRSHVLVNPGHNIVGCVPINLRWAGASTLHFFTASEEADALAEFKNADKFLTPLRECRCDGTFFESDGAVCGWCEEPESVHKPERLYWLGAYGDHAMPQIAKCIAKLRKEPNTRRAIVTMANLDIEDINRPHCWTSLHFLKGRDGLDMIVYQRSLNLAIMPYDTINLTNILNYVAHQVELPAANLRWLIGSLHCLPSCPAPVNVGQRNGSMLYHPNLLADPVACKEALNT
jgi:hypothetical protein